MEDIWAIFCGASDCLNEKGKPCNTDWVSVIQLSSCINHALIICFDVILLLFFLFTLFSMVSSEYCIFPLSLTASLRGKHISRTPLRLLSILAFVFAGIFAGMSLVASILYKEELIVSGFFALLKVTTLSAGPLLLNAFIKVAEGDAAFKNEGFLLVILLFISKNLESLSQRQWYFRCRLIGVKVSSLLTAAIYKKQIRLSNAAKLMHSSGEIMNYVTVDAYRIGEFPFWLHQTWTTSVQLCFALIILFRAVGLATIAPLVVIILTVLCNTPLAKLQHKFQSKLMVAQDDRLKAISEALVTMKVLKLYAWETHFKSVIENLRRVEEKWLSAVQLLKAYNSFLFWSSSVLVSAATFGACYFLGVPLYASNVFTFIATLRLVQDPIRTIPDVIGVVIQAKVSFARIVKFLEAPELENANVRQKHNFGCTDHAILMKSANVSWEENPPRPTLRNINLEVKPVQKIAICGEVGSGMSTLLSAILGEVPSIQGTVQVFGTVAYVSQSAWIQTGNTSWKLSGKTVLLVTHQVDFLPAFDMLMSDGEILHAAPYHELLASTKEFEDLVNAHKETAGSERVAEVNSSSRRESNTREIRKTDTGKKSIAPEGDQLIKKEREVGDTGFTPYVQYLNQNKGYLFFVIAILSHVTFVIGQITQNSWMAAHVSLDLSIVDLDIPFNLIFAFGATINFYSNLMVLAVVTWQVLVISIPMVYLAIQLQKYYYASAKELMRINGTTKSFVANHLAESIAGVVTIRAFKEEDRFFTKTFELIDINASPFFHNFAANEWLIQRLETISATVLATSALCMVLLPSGTFSSGFIGMALSYGLSLNMSLVFSINNQCTLANYIISVERLNQYMHIPSEAPEIVNENRPPVNWPTRGKVEIQDLQIRYREDSPLVLRGISCTFEGGHKIGVVGRTGKTTLIGALFRLVESTAGRILVDGIDISKIGLPDLRSRFGIIAQDPTLFNGTVLGKCQLKEPVEEKEKGLDSLVVEDGSNWSMGQWQLFCLGRALLRKAKILVLEEATASIDNTTDMILQKTIRTEFSTVITVAHRIPTVMDCTMVLAISDGKLVKCDEPMKLMGMKVHSLGSL
ncbi:hypothetical protein RND71_018230 [Anisodus tanguticus]|uniref:ABC-type xenobiotic transporter n=1 Tax=Anisodus tanguticus TaxID=243964 RepID=A0AAE1S503_9SOLA|nr:hypothetical protein RND71_018230 [Anisodus tanguticus]